MNLMLHHMTILPPKSSETNLQPVHQDQWPNQGIKQLCSQPWIKQMNLRASTAGVKSSNPNIEGCHRQPAKATGSLESTDSKVHWMPLKLSYFDHIKHLTRKAIVNHVLKSTNFQSYQISESGCKEGVNLWKMFGEDL
jgi:hypothetical protein